MTQADRDRLVTLKNAKKRLITQRAVCRKVGIKHSASEAVALR
jgi:hypothetical protein